MLRNIFAVIGLYAVCKLAHEHYRKYAYYKQRVDDLDKKHSKGDDGDKGGSRAGPDAY